GASSGIGKAICEQLRDQGATVFALSRSQTKFREATPTEKSGAGKILPISLDLMKKSSCKTAIAEIARYTKKIDIIINNAGKGHFEPFVKSDSTTDQETIDTNLTGTIGFFKLLYLNFFSHQGYVIFTTSLAGKIGFKNLAVYSAT